MPQAGRRRGPQNQAGPDRDGGSFEPKKRRHRGRLAGEARRGLGVGVHRWHQNIVARDGSTGELGRHDLTEGEPQKRKRPGLCLESRDAR
jgi:hypothetical protein